MRLINRQQGQRIRPLETLDVEGAVGLIRVTDGAGREYHHGGTRFVVGGALGTHVVTDESGSKIAFRVEAKTEIKDRQGRFEELLTMLHYTILAEQGEEHTCLWNGKIYRYFICWLRDHVHVLKGMKYFSSEVKTAIELYRDGQREDGMIWDNLHRRGPDPNYWEVRFTEGGFYRSIANDTFDFKRIPVENDVEYLYLEGIYNTWKATGDDAWMAGFLDSAKRALDYTVGDTDYRFSTKLGLLKRGYTIDTWDFQADVDCTVEGDIMRIRPGTTRFGAMFGDTTGYVAGCRQLAEMLEHAGDPDATRYRTRADELAKRLDEVSWVGTHYRMHVPEDPAVVRDLGVDEASQVSLSNAYSLNRGIDPDKRKAIIESYQRIRAGLPEGSPGEWYTIYPPFERGFGGHSDKWQYMNASVTPIVAGELAHGAFQNGYEGYGADILLRLSELGRRFNGQFHCSYTGSLPAAPERGFQTVDLSGFSNARVAGSKDRHADLTPWPAGDNDLHEMPTGRQTISDVPFDVADGHLAMGLSEVDGYSRTVAVPISTAGEAPANLKRPGRPRSLYLLHTVSGGGGPVGVVALSYGDGTVARRAVIRGRDVVHWWMPELPTVFGRRVLDIGWKGKNAVLPYVGVAVWGIDNPHPEKDLTSVVFEAAPEGAIWHVIGMTLSDSEVWFPPSPISFGIPNGWGAAAVVYALIEGLAGVVDEATAFGKVRIEPRWASAGEDEADVTVHYPAPDGYVTYRYRHDETARRVTVELTGSGDEGQLSVLLPNGEYRTAALTHLAPQTMEFTY